MEFILVSSLYKPWKPFIHSFIHSFTKHLRQLPPLCTVCPALVAQISPVCKEIILALAGVAQWIECRLRTKGSWFNS